MQQVSATRDFIVLAEKSAARKRNREREGENVCISIANVIAFAINNGDLFSEFPFEVCDLELSERARCALINGDKKCAFACSKTHIVSSVDDFNETFSLFSRLSNSIENSIHSFNSML